MHGKIILSELLHYFIGVKMKKFSAFILCLLFMITCGLAGCAGFSVNRVKYYNETVATVGNTHITRYELLTAYNSYGSNYYVSQLGKSEKEAMGETLNLLMDRESLYQFALTDASYKPTAYQINTIIENIYTSMDKTMAEYVKQTKRVLNVTIKEDSTDEDSKTAYKYEDYNTILAGKRAELKTKTVYYTDETKTVVSSTPTEYKEVVDYISYVKVEEPTFACVLGEENLAALQDFDTDATLQLIIDKYFSNFRTSLDNEEKQDAIYNKSISLLAQDLISSEKYLQDENGKAYNTVTKDLIYRYFKKTFKDQVKSQYLTNVRTNYLENAQDELSISALLEKYVSLMQTNYNKYANFEKSYKDAMKDAGTKADEILYHPDTTDGTQFGYFIHCLIKFDEDTQTTAIKNLDKLKSTGMSDEAYRTAYDNIIAQTTAKERDAKTGLIEDDAKEYTLDEVLAEYKEITSLDEFINFMFKFSEDTATLSQGMPYVVGTNGFSSMETAFTNEAVRLIEQGVVGAMTPATKNTDSSKGDTMCITSYGVHFLYYIGDVKMFDIPFGEIETAYISTTDKITSTTYYTDKTKTVISETETPYFTHTYNENNLYKKELNPLTHETYFDMLFDKVYPASSSSDSYAESTGYSAREDEMIQTIRKSNPAKIYQTKLDATKTSL